MGACSVLRDGLWIDTFFWNEVLVHAAGASSFPKPSCLDRTRLLHFPSQHLRQHHRRSPPRLLLHTLRAGSPGFFEQFNGRDEHAGLRVSISLTGTTSLYKLGLGFKVFGFDFKLGIFRMLLRILPTPAEGFWVRRVGCARFPVLGLTV